MLHLDDLLEVAKNPGSEVLSGIAENSIPELSGVAKSFLEAVGVFDPENRLLEADRLVDAEKHFGVFDAERHSNLFANAEKHFQAVHEFWMNKDFVPLLDNVSNRFAYLFDLANTYGKHTSFSLQHSHAKYIRKDPSLKEILDATNPSFRMRAAISILIRYWCEDNMMEEYFFKNFGLYALGLDISFAAAAAQETPLNSEGEKEMFFGLPEKRAAGPTSLAPESKRTRPTTMTPNFFSPIGQLVNVPSIIRLAKFVEQNYPKLVVLAEQLLITLKDDNFDVTPMFGSKRPYLFHCEAMWDFWRNEDFRVLMREQILEDPHLLVMVKMFSDRLKREIAVDRLQRIQLTLLPKLKTFLAVGGFDLKKPADTIRCTFSIMMRYWACLGMAMRLREKWGFRPWTNDGKPLIKYSDKYKDEQIGEVLYHPVHNDDPADCKNFVLTRWYEANETEINHLLDKEWRDVLTGRYLTDKEEIKSLLGKIDLDTRVNLVMKKDTHGKLCMTCTKLTPVACAI